MKRTNHLPISTKSVELRQFKECCPPKEDVYCEIYDSFYEAETGKWLETACSDNMCLFCRTRPDIHSVNCKCFDDSID